jgi:hypothetical protein
MEEWFADLLFAGSLSASTLRRIPLSAPVELSLAVSGLTPCTLTFLPPARPDGGLRVFAFLRSYEIPLQLAPKSEG